MQPGGSAGLGPCRLAQRSRHVGWRSGPARRMVQRTRARLAQRGAGPELVLPGRRWPVVEDQVQQPADDPDDDRTPERGGEAGDVERHR
jgi:hypothetical protein